MKWTAHLLVGVTAFVAAPSQADPADYTPPERVSVLPVFLTPEGEEAPTDEEVGLLLRHLEWTRERYLEMLGGRATFAVAEREPLVVLGAYTLEHYRTLPQGGAPQFVSEVLGSLGASRFSAPYVFLIVIVNRQDGYPTAGGRPLNGGLNTGGGMMMTSLHTVVNSRCFQSTLQHELGHAFGLLHSNAYGFDQGKHISIMSYNPAHHTDGFTPSPTPGVLAPEDIRALALNQRVFGGLSFEPDRDVPEGYPLPPGVRWLPPMDIPRHPPYAIEATTTAAELLESEVARLPLSPATSAAAEAFDAARMWCGGAEADGWVAVDLRFPFEVALTGIAILTGHGGGTDAAEAVRVAARVGGEWTEAAEDERPGLDARIAFEEATARQWRLAFRAGESGRVAVRGLRWFRSDAEVFPAMLPAEE